MTFTDVNASCVRSFDGEDTLSVPGQPLYLKTAGGRECVQSKSTPRLLPSGISDKPLGAPEVEEDAVVDATWRRAFETAVSGSMVR
jgi:hypothetical protein